MRPSSALLVGIVKLLVGAYRALDRHARRTATQRIYFANHTSHIDTLAIWSSLPRALRRRTRPIAARDYWGKGLRKYIATRGFGAVLIDRAREDPNSGSARAAARLPARRRFADHLSRRHARHERGAGAFRSGLCRLGREFPNVELVPVYLDNLHRSLPKGALLPVPMVCTVRFGAPLAVGPTTEGVVSRTRARRGHRAVEPGRRLNPLARYSARILLAVRQSVRVARGRLADRRRAARGVPATRRSSGEPRESQRARERVVGDGRRSWPSPFSPAPTMTLILFALASFFALREFITLTPSRAGDRLPLSLAFFLIIPAQFVLIGLQRTACSRSSFPCTRSCCCRRSRRCARDIEEFLSRTREAAVGPDDHRLLPEPRARAADAANSGRQGRSALLLFYLLLIVQMSDVMQYVFGKLFGRTKIAPLVSPSKTVEGFVGGGLARDRDRRRDVVDHAVHLAASPRPSPPSSW